MEFDTDTNEFVLDTADMLALGVPSELQRWPIEDVDHLFEEAALADGKINDIDTSYFPGGASRSQVIAEQQKRRDTLKQIREVVGKYAMVEADFDKLLDS